MFTPPNWVSALPESSVLKEIIEQRCVSASQLGLLAQIGWTECCDREKETAISLKIKNDEKGTLFLSVVFDWLHGGISLSLSKTTKRASPHTIELDGRPLDELLLDYANNLSTPTFKSFDKNSFIQNLDKNSLAWKEVLARLNLLSNEFEL